MKRREWHLIQFISLSVAPLFTTAHSEHFWRVIQKKLENWIWGHEIKKKSFFKKTNKRFWAGAIFLGQSGGSKYYFFYGWPYMYFALGFEYRYPQWFFSVFLDRYDIGPRLTPKFPHFAYFILQTKMNRVSYYVHIRPVPLPTLAPTKQKNR